MTLELFLDIETVKTVDAELIELVTEKIAPPGNMSKPETIAKWEAEDKPQIIKDTIAKTALDGTYGKLCCIGFGFGDGTVSSIVSRNEKEILTKFFDEVEKHCTDKKSLSTKQLPKVIGHGVTDFDLNFMWKRAIINGVKPSPLLPWKEKAWHVNIGDTMYMWDSSPDKRISLHKLCVVLGVPSPKDIHGMNGADVAALWNKRDYQKIGAYCVDDVVAMRQCYRKMCI